MYITIQSFNNMHGSKPLKLNGLIKLVKEPDNKYDAEAIACEMRYFGKIGYVANSTNTVVIGSMSAGRLYDKINDEHCRGGKPRKRHTLSLRQSGKD